MFSFVVRTLVWATDSRGWGESEGNDRLIAAWPPLRVAHPFELDVREFPKKA